LVDSKQNSNTKFNKNRIAAVMYKMYHDDGTTETQKYIFITLKMYKYTIFSRLIR
jgi:hypothetical protein